MPREPAPVAGSLASAQTVRLLLLYDDRGRRTLLTRGNGTTTSYGYDPVSRLAALSNDLAGAGSDLNLTFAYNPASQIATRSGSYGLYAYQAYANGNVASPVNALNQPASVGGTSIGHDGRGNVTSIGSASYTYTSDNLLSNGPTGHYAYDPLGRLFHEGQAWSILRHDGDRIALEVDATSGAVRRRYVHGPGTDEPLVWYEGSGTSDRRFFHADERGSVVAISDNSGNAMGYNAYDEYGRPQGPNGAGTLFGRFGYTGQAWLPEIGMYYYRARIYNPDLGRFMQTDPIGHLGGMNLYAYVLNDPVNFVDPSGLTHVDIEVILRRQKVDGWYRPTLPSDIRDLGRHFTNDRIGAPPSERLGGEEECWSDDPTCVATVRGSRQPRLIASTLPRPSLGWGPLRGLMTIIDNIIGYPTVCIPMEGCYDPLLQEGQDRPPPGSLPIDQTPWSGDHQDIKGGIGAGPSDNVKISPDGHVWEERPDGTWVDHGPAGAFTGSGQPSGRRGRDRRGR